VHSELAALQAAGIEWEIVPGVSSALAAPLSAGAAAVGFWATSVARRVHCLSLLISHLPWSQPTPAGLYGCLLQAFRSRTRSTAEHSR
jgi:hypothetical protein